MADQHDDAQAPSDLFSREAGHNAQVIPPDRPRTHDELWSTEAADADTSGDLGAWGAPGAAPAAPPRGPGGVFTSDPVARDDGVIDEAIDEPPPWPRFATRHDPPSPPLWRDADEPAATADWSEWMNDQPPMASSAGAATATADLDGRTAVGDMPPGAEPDGFEAAVQGLEPAQRDYASLPLTIAGALLDQSERVDGLLVGSMFGLPAALVLTSTRVLVVNGRRWRPVVDSYLVPGKLTVRGRSERGVAVLSIADDERLSLLDGIADVDAAVTIANLIRVAAAGHPPSTPS